MCSAQFFVLSNKKAIFYIARRLFMLPLLPNVYQTSLQFLFALKHLSFCYILTKIQPEDATHFLSGFYSTRRSFTHRHKLLAKQKRKAAVPAFLCYNVHKSKRLTQCIYIYHEQDSTMLHNNKRMLIFLYSHKETLFVACYP